MHKEETPTSSTSPQRNTAALQRIINCTDFIWQSATCCFVELCVVDCWLPDTSLVAGLEEYEERGRGEPAAGWRGRRPTTQHGPGRTLNINRRTHVGATRLIWITGHMCHTCGQMLEGEWFTWGGGGWSTVHAASMTRVPTVWWSPAHVTVTVLITVTHLKQTHTHTHTLKEWASDFWRPLWTSLSNTALTPWPLHFLRQSSTPSTDTSWHFWSKHTWKKKQFFF